MVGQGPSSARLRDGVAMVRGEVSLHPAPFAAAVTGAAVFALATVGSSFAVQWVIDHVIVPRFEDGEVAVGTVATGLLLLVAVGVLRATGVVCRRVFAPIPFALGTVLLLTVSAVWLIVSDVVLGLCAVAVFPVLAGLNVLYQRRVARYYTEAQDHLGALSAAVHESFEGVQLIKAYGAESRETERLSLLAGRLRDSRVQAVQVRGTFEALLDVVPSLTNAMIVVVGAMRVDAGAVTVGQLSSFVYLFTLLVLPLRLIGYVLSEVPHSLAGWRRVREIVDEPLVADPVAAIVPADGDTALGLDDVVFVFDGADPSARPALDQVDVHVSVGRVVAVVGPTGAGKSTLVELMAGLVEPTTGRVRRTTGPTALVFQEAFLLAGSIRKNLTLGEERTDDELWRALELAEAAGFVRDTPHGLDTVVGERGVSLSGGQRQRIALARALLRRPALLLLDDTTSALDPATEGRVLANLRRDLAGTTVVIVASRPSTIALADDVVYLAAGTVVDHGPHRDLMARRPGYRALVEAFESDRAEVVAAGGGAAGAGGGGAA